MDLSGHMTSVKGVRSNSPPPKLKLYFGVICVITLVSITGLNAYCPPNTTCRNTFTLQNATCPTNNTFRNLITTWPSGETTLEYQDHPGGQPWTVFQHRVSGAENFYRDWNAYVYGFGSKSGSFWLGLENIHQTCNSSSPCEMRVFMRWDGEPWINNNPDNFHYTIPRSGDGCYTAHYSDFYLGGVETYYRLFIWGSNGIPWSNIMRNDGVAFSTVDNDNDGWSSDNCAQSRRGGWWYGVGCGLVNINGLWGASNGTGVAWHSLTGMDSSLQYTEMQFRPRGNGVGRLY